MKRIIPFALGIVLGLVPSVLLYLTARTQERMTKDIANVPSTLNVPDGTRWSMPAQTQPDDPDWLPNPDKPLRPQLALYAESEPKKAAYLALNIPWTGDGEEDPPINDPIGTVMRVWAKSNPTAASAFYESIADPVRQLGAAIGLVEGLAEHDVEQAAAWVAHRVGHSDAVAFMSIVTSYMEPKRAERWIAGLPLDENARELTRGLVSSRPRAFVEEKQR